MPDSALPEKTHDAGPSPGEEPSPRPGAFERDAALVLETLQDGVIFLDYQWRITYANPRARIFSHIQEEDLNSRSHWEIYPDTVGTEIEQRYRKVMETRVPDDYSVYYAPFDLWTEIHILPMETGIALVYSNLTAQKREEAARLAAQRQLEQVLDVTTDAVVSLNRDYEFTFLNRRARELLAPTGELLGRNLWKVYPDAYFEGSVFLDSYRRTMEERLPSSFESYYPAPLNMWLSVRSMPAEGGIIIFFRDVTEERADKEALRLNQQEAERQHAEIETVYRTAPVGLALFDPIEFRYLRLNDRQADFFGLTPDQVVGRPVTELAPIPGLREMFEQVARGEAVRDHLLEGELATRPGEHRYWNVNYYPVYGVDGSVQAISAVSIEITRQKQAEAALIQSEKLAAVGRLATSISHEINNPLEAVTNLLYLIRMHAELTPSLREYVEVAQAELARVSQIATQTLRFHRQSVRPTAVTAEKLAAPVLDLYHARLANAGIHVQAKYCASESFLCFENDIRQVLNNLIANAIDAMRHGGRLVVRAHNACDYRTGRQGVRITVADTGHGMPRAVQARVYEPFYTTKDLNGTGLGLWISSEIVERHGGRLRLRSSEDAAHHGTVFSLFLPYERA